MSLWNLPLAVDMPEVRTPTPFPALRAGRSWRYGVTVLDAARKAVADLTNEPGCEEVRRCASCGGASTDSILGLAGWHTLRRCESRSVAFCPDCYREFEPVRMAVAGRYAAACENLRASKKLAAERPYCVDARAALALASLVFGLERREWLDAEQEGGTRKAS